MIYKDPQKLISSIKQKRGTLRALHVCHPIKINISQFLKIKSDSHFFIPVLSIYAT